MKPAIYIRSSSGFGNKIFDLISAIYLQKKYKTRVYFAVDLSIYDSPTDPFFGKIFYKSYLKIKYIYMNQYRRLKKNLPISHLWIDDLKNLPKKIKRDVRFGGLHKFVYEMYSSLNANDKEYFEINPTLLTSDTLEHINKKISCVHVRYGDKLCYSLEELKTKYTPYSLPIYKPEYYIKQIQDLLQKDLDEILVMTDSVELVRKYIINPLGDLAETFNPKVILYESHYLDAFYIMTKAQYIVLSHSTFSFAAGYFNENATCYLLKKYMEDPSKDYLLEDSAISPKWIIIDNKDYLLNYDQVLLKKMVQDYAECGKYIKQSGGSSRISNRIISNLITSGPIEINSTLIQNNLIINGTLDFNQLEVLNTMNVYGTVYGSDGYFSKVIINGQFNITNMYANKLLCNGTFNAVNVKIKEAAVIGQIYVTNSKFKIIEIISEIATFISSNIKLLIINNEGTQVKLIRILSMTNINHIQVNGNSCTIIRSSDTNINSFSNATVEIEPV